MVKREQLVISAVGTDRVGLVRRIAGFVTEHGANIEDSTMAALAGDFAILMLVSGDAQALASLNAGRLALAQRTGLTVLMHKTTPTAEQGLESRMVLTASCLDHPGVVHRLTSVLSDAEINIVWMETRTVSAPESGAPVFQFEAHLRVPPHVDPVHLQAQLQAIGQEQDIDIRVTQAAEEST